MSRGGGFASLGKLAPPHRPCAWLWLEVQHRAARLQIDRHRVLMVHDQPLATDLTEASGPTQPEIGLLPSVHGSAYPVEAVGECNVIAHRDVEVVNFIAYRTLERREDLFPGFPEGTCSHVSQRGHDVERHDLLRVERHDAFDVLVTNRLDPTLYYPFDFGFIVFLVFFDCHSFLLPLACYESQILVVICTFWGYAADFLAMLLLKASPLLSPVKPFSRDEAHENMNRELPGEWTRNPQRIPKMYRRFIAFRPRCSYYLAGRAPQAPV